MKELDMIIVITLTSWIFKLYHLPDIYLETNVLQKNTTYDNSTKETCQTTLLHDIFSMDEIPKLYNLSNLSLTHVKQLQTHHSFSL